MVDDQKQDNQSAYTQSKQEPQPAQAQQQPQPQRVQVPQGRPLTHQEKQAVIKRAIARRVARDAQKLAEFRWARQQQAIAYAREAQAQKNKPRIEFYTRDVPTYATVRPDFSRDPFRRGVRK